MRGPRDAQQRVVVVLWSFEQLTFRAVSSDHEHSAGDSRGVMASDEGDGVHPWFEGDIKGEVHVVRVFGFLIGSIEDLVRAEEHICVA